jgi:hypothetical protein
MPTDYPSATGGNWSSGSSWLSGNVPDYATDVIMDSSHPAQVTVDVNTWTCFCRNITQSAGCGILTISNTGILYIYAHAVFISGKLAMGGSSSSIVKQSTGEFTSGGNAISRLTCSGSGTVGTIKDALNITNNLSFYQGSFVLGAFTHTINAITSSGNIGTSGDFRGSTINLGSPSPCFNATSGFTITVDTSTIFNVTGSGNTTFNGNGLTYNDLINQKSSGILTITGNNTFRNIGFSAGNTSSTYLTSGTTQTITGLSGTGSGSTYPIFRSVTPGSYATLSATSGTIQPVAWNIRDIYVSGGATFNISQSLCGTGNSGWAGMPSNNAFFNLF